MNRSLTPLDRHHTDRASKPLTEVQKQLDRAARRLGLDPGVTQLLRSPFREHRVMVPVRMDDGTTNVFEGIRVQHNDARGPLQKLDERMTTAFVAVHERAVLEQLSLREAAYLIAVERVAHACRQRGWV